jgi:L-rhamnose mutarotase
MSGSNAARAGWGSRSRLRAGAETGYADLHRPERVWPQLSALVTDSGFHNYTIFRDGLDLFGYFEADDPEAANERMRSSDVFDRWMELMDSYLDVAEPREPWTPMTRIYFHP